MVVTQARVQLDQLVNGLVQARVYARRILKPDREGHRGERGIVLAHAYQNDA